MTQRTQCKILKVMKANVLPGIRRVEFCPANQVVIENQRVIDNTSVVMVVGSFAPIEVEGLASVAVSSEKVSGQTIYTTKLSFYMKDCGGVTRARIAQFSVSPCCFRITDVYKKEYLIGGETRPFPTVLYQFKNENEPDGARGYTVEITYINTYSLLIIE